AAGTGGRCADPGRLQPGRHPFLVVLERPSQGVLAGRRPRDRGLGPGRYGGAMADTGGPMTAAVTAPTAKTVPQERVHHGDRFVDEYEWLRDKDNPEVIAYLEAENAYTEAQTAQLAPLREKIFDEIKSRTQETDLSVPTRLGEYWYYSRSFEG